MGRLFDSQKQGEKTQDLANTARDAIEAAELDQASKALEERLGPERQVSAVSYVTERRGKWRIEHAQVGEDYVFQIFTLKIIPYDWPTMMTKFISVLDGIFPRSVQIYYKPPSEIFKEQMFKFYTIRFKKVTLMPGWEHAVQKKALDAIFEIDAWKPTGTR